MNIYPLTNVSVTATAHAASSTASSQNANPLQSADSMFMQLLTAQLQNQSPLDPVDPTQFTAQLVQFNMLDQLTQINQTLQSAFPAQGPSSSGSSSSHLATQGAR